MLRVFEDGAARSDLDDLPHHHHGHAVAALLHHRHVVRNEQVRQAHLGLQFLHQFDHARLHRHVQRRHGLVRHDDLGVHRQRSRDAQALALPAREFMRKAPDGVRRQSHQFEKLLRKRQRLTPGHAVHHGTLGHNFAHALTGIQCSIRILEHHLHQLGMRAPRRAALERQLLAGQRDAAGIGRQQA
ncbi:hypothetical protein G6F50_014882 [Rhizopus delemar]|uniref:Uncharacterized protein n=1 Tax=Rhizopus delemar TaxID=936053 RepID=A0A9P7C5I4_9FUNG|nr:hypothetical protein G6F50_014882 [Rhizopus delemar]